MDQAGRRRRRIRRPPTNTAPAPTTANSSTSAPVKGRLLVVVVLAGAFSADSYGRALVEAGVLEAAAMAGVTTQPGSLMVAGETQLAAAPATVGATRREVTAKPEPMINRLAHIMVALLPVGTAPLRFPSQTTKSLASLVTHTALSATPFAMTIT
jgi:hypothetical protein